MKTRIALIIALVISLTSFAPTTTSIDIQAFTLSAKGGCGFVDLSWTPVQGAQTYWIYRGPEPGKEYSTPLTDFPIRATSYRDEINIENGKQYCYFVKAVDSTASEFAQSTEACAITRCATEHTCKLVLKYQADNVDYWVNDQVKGPMETPPIIINSRLFLVIRYVTAELKGTSLEWLASERKVTIAFPNGKRIELWIDKKDAKVNGKIVQIDPNNPKVVPVIRDGRSLMPMRFIAENAGATGQDGIKWFEETKTVQLTIADPICTMDGFRYPTANQIEGSLFEFSVEYHSGKGNIPDVALDLARKGASSSIRLGRSLDNKVVTGDFKSIEVPKPTIQEVPTEAGKARLFIWEVKLEPGLMHFYRFAAGKELMPEKGYLGPIIAPLPEALTIEKLDIANLVVGEKPTVQGYFTHEPYPMLVNNFWNIFLQRPSDPKALFIKFRGIFVKLPEDQKIAEGSFISAETSLMMSGEVKIFNITKIVYKEEITIERIKGTILGNLGRHMLEPSPSKYAIIFHGRRNDVEVTDTYGSKHYYSRLRADIGGDAFHYYPAALELGVPKENIKMFYGSGDSEIDLICADDGDGNPFNFTWNDAEYRRTQEHDAQIWWRAGDGWSVRPATIQELDTGFSEIVASIASLPLNQDVEIYILTTSHGGRYGDAGEPDGFGGAMCSYSGYDVSDNHLVAKINECYTAAGFTRGFKVRSLHQFCESGEFVDDYQNEFSWDGSDTFQLATAARYDESSWGQWPSPDTISYAEAGSTFSIPFIANIRYQLSSLGSSVTWDGETESNPPWKHAYDYALTVDPYALAGTSHPMYWHSNERYLVHAGPAFVDEDARRGLKKIAARRLKPLPEPDPIVLRQMITLCKIGADTSQLVFDICNCNTGRKLYPQESFDIINKGTNKLIVTKIEPDESVLKKCVSDQAIFFSSSPPCLDGSEVINFEVGPGKSSTLYMCIAPNKLQAQPLDKNGYMLTEDGSSAFIDLPIKITYSTTTSEGKTLSSFIHAFAKIRVTGVNYEIMYKIQASRQDSFRNIGNLWRNDELTKVSISPAPPSVGDDIIAAPTFNGDINMSVMTPISNSLLGGLALTDYLTAFRIEFPIVEINNDLCADKAYDWGNAAVENLGKTRMKTKWSIQLPKQNTSEGRSIVLEIEPGIRSSDGYSAILGKHDFKIEVNLNPINCCNKREKRRTIIINLSIEFIK